MKKEKLCLVILLSMLSFSLWAQPNFRERMKERRQEIEQVKKEFITQRINLKPEQEKDFWEVYDNYIEQKIDIKRQIASLKNQSDNLTSTDKELEESLDKLFDLQQTELDLDRKTKTELLKIINIRQLTELYKSENEFIRKLVLTLRERRVGNRE